MTARTGDDIWGERTPYTPGQAWPVRADLHLVDGLTVDEVDSWVPSACYCAARLRVGHRGKDGRDGLLPRSSEDRINHGASPKGLYGWRSDDRLTLHMTGTAQDRRVRPDEAMDLITSRSRELLDRKGPLAHGLTRASDVGGLRGLIGKPVRRHLICANTAGVRRLLRGRRRGPDAALVDDLEAEPTVRLAQHGDRIQIVWSGALSDCRLKILRLAVDPRRTGS